MFWHGDSHYVLRIYIYLYACLLALHYSWALQIELRDECSLLTHPYPGSSGDVPFLVSMMRCSQPIRSRLHESWVSRDAYVWLEVVSPAHFHPTICQHRAKKYTFQRSSRTT
ncbi:hypothetical protein BD289DRAFT_159461 [Coniella lustricola]|uniref:Uncharacterized protein n=1 Tax=Coniella lustricola TaxID=2025994 RepID=A0A2T3AEL1_9PEZI|nr:hypothetical protein BD289DRAFT_159461 [Coniella lustricola]